MQNFNVSDEIRYELMDHNSKRSLSKYACSLHPAWKQYLNNWYLRGWSCCLDITSAPVYTNKLISTAVREKRVFVSLLAFAIILACMLLK